MRFSLVSLLLLILIASIYLAGWNEPSFLSAGVCGLTFALALLASVILFFTGRTESRWAACGFACTGIAAVVIFWTGEPVTWNHVWVERLVASQRETVVSWQWRNQFEQQRLSSPRSPRRVPDNSRSMEQLKLKVLHANVLFLISCCGAFVAVLCRKGTSIAICWLALITLGVTGFNGWCVLHASAFWYEGALGMTALAFVTSIGVALASRPPSRLAMAAFVLVGGTYFVWSLRGTTDYINPLPADSLISALYKSWIPPQNRAVMGYVVDGVVVFPLVTRPLTGIFPWEFAEIVHCFLATSFGSLAAWVALAGQCCRSAYATQVQTNGNSDSP